jgi:hypothetical protein
MNGYGMTAIGAKPPFVKKAKVSRISPKLRRNSRMGTRAAPPRQLTWRFAFVTSIVFVCPPAVRGAFVPCNMRTQLLMRDNAGWQITQIGLRYLGSLEALPLPTTTKSNSSNPLLQKPRQRWPRFSRRSDWLWTSREKV